MARPWWRLRLSAVAAFFGWRRSAARIAVAPMSDDWLRELEMSRRMGDP